jgi:hypothetical protein
MRGSIDGNNTTEAVERQEGVRSQESGELPLYKNIFWVLASGDALLAIT